MPARVGEVWLMHGDVNEVSDDHPLLVAEGSAEKGRTDIPFRASVRIGAQSRACRARTRRSRARILSAKSGSSRRFPSSSPPAEAARSCCASIRGFSSRTSISPRSQKRRTRRSFTSSTMFRAAARAPICTRRCTLHVPISITSNGWTGRNRFQSTVAFRRTNENTFGPMAARGRGAAGRAFCLLVRRQPGPGERPAARVRSKTQVRDRSSSPHRERCSHSPGYHFPRPGRTIRRSSTAGRCASSTCSRPSTRSRSRAPGQSARRSNRGPTRWWRRRTDRSRFDLAKDSPDNIDGVGDPGTRAVPLAVLSTQNKNGDAPFATDGTRYAFGYDLVAATPRRRT